MLEPWIIDRIRRREEDRRRREHPQLELPVPDPRWPSEGYPEMDNGGWGNWEPERGVVIIGI
jgi:hypothetical protein